ncbi:MAG: hypothetical protein HOQ28_00800 [Thermoleophilia bacterium]|nr:hypothetical protein [Thermoleophilia bacterium]
MTRPASRRLRPLVGAVCFAPLMAEGIVSALDGVADVCLLPAEVEDLPTLLRTLSPDAIVVDGDCPAARAYTDEHRLPLFVVPVESVDGQVPSPDSLRALVVGSLLAGQVHG